MIMISLFTHSNTVKIQDLNGTCVDDNNKCV